MSTHESFDIKPAPNVKSIRFFKQSKRKPKAGDRRITKKHGLQIRIHDRARDHDGKPWASLMSNGRPVFSWCKPEHLASWDQHYLSFEEKAKYFPEEDKIGYMQQRGAA